LIEFISVEGELVGSVYLQQRSLLVFEEDAYYKYKHRILCTTEDVINEYCLNRDQLGFDIGISVPRDPVRLSLTMRRVLKTKSADSNVAATDNDAQEMLRQEKFFYKSITE
jgi:hypothetical protein